MQIILLCGGSGTRLWPLSNEARSKQFIKLFKSPEGCPESMFERVLRQIRESDLKAEINITTSQSQIDSVVSQGGEDITIITEPSRRDTFPAITLAASYLSSKKKIGDDEVVVVMPCDPYTEASYFDTISKMAESVKENLADLILMGISPTEPSSKFGYILPSIKYPGLVDRFIEKPDTSKALSLIAEGALWNGGAFAFKLGYMLEVISYYSQNIDFDYIINNYDNFPKISFDYEVVEKAKSVGVVKFEGEWKDLGTWNSLCKELPTTISGNVHSINNVGTTIINELPIPIVSYGCNNIIIAASPDGILVADIETSEAIKSTVKEVSSRPMYEDRRWGNYRVTDYLKFPDGSLSLTKCLMLKPGASISYHKHKHRKEIWTVVEGSGDVVTGIDRRVIKPGDVIVIPKEMMHAVRATTKLTIIEVQYGLQLDEGDIERFGYEW